MSDVIAAISTGKQPCAIGILRLSGSGCADICDRVLRLDQVDRVSLAPNRKLLRGTLFDIEHRPIDSILAVYTRAPHTYTGEDTVELQCHGSPAVLAAGLDALFAAGARQAGPGEFTKRAFLNGQMDLTEAEAVIDLIDAETADAAANAAGQLGGAMFRRIQPIYDDLCDMMSHYDAVLDYPDEDIEPFQMDNYIETLRSSLKTLEALLATYRRGQLVKKGIRTIILGKPNVGKSSFLNTLAGYERVIVTDIAGTTRDSIEESVRVGHHLLRLVDTAGIHDTEDQIERIGVERAEQAVSDADLVIYVCDASRPLDELDQHVIDLVENCPCSVALLNKSDLPAVVTSSDLPFTYIIPFSSVTGEGPEYLEEALDMLFTDEVNCDGSLLTNARQAGAIRSAAESLKSALASMREGLTPDAVLCDAEAAMNALGEVTGKTFREDIVNRIFSRFCVGK